MVAVLPVTDDELPAACRFLARGFEAQSAQERWLAAFRQRWAAERPNYGYMLQDRGAIVGVIGALYSDQVIRGRRERFCNINNWYVDPAYRKHSIALLSRLLAQRDLHFTNLTPRPDLAPLFLALRFRYVDDGKVTYLVNLPSPRAGHSEVVTDPQAVADVLGADDARVFRDHIDCPGLMQAAVGARADGFCHVAFHKATVRHVPCVAVLHASEPHILSRHLAAMRSHFLRRCAAPLARIESRMLAERPPLAIELQREPHSMLLSRTLAPADVSNLYTELAALHANGAA